MCWPTLAGSGTYTWLITRIVLGLALLDMRAFFGTHHRVAETQRGHRGNRDKDLKRAGAGMGLGAGPCAWRGLGAHPT